MEIKVVLIGAGNLAHHLGQQLHKSGIHLVQIFSRTTGKAQRLSELTGNTPFTTNLNELSLAADLYIVAVHDDAIAAVAEKLEYLGKQDKFIVHTSGATPSTVFDKWFSQYGVFYPFQSFSVDSILDFMKVPICIYANNKRAQYTLERLGKNLGCQTFLINDEQRPILHLNGVLVNNFTNHLYQMAWQISEAEDIPFELLHPLIRETAEKVMQHPPIDMQTGPAIRGDKKSIQRHLDYLEKWATYRDIYGLFTNSISTHKKSRKI